MKAESCIYEPQLLDALSRGFVGTELRVHVDLCGSCAEIEMVVGSLLREHEVAVSEPAPLPSASTMWARIQLRERQEAEARSRRMLLVGQAVSLLTAVVLAFAILGGELAIGLHDLFRTVRLSTPLLLALGTWLILAPVAGYVLLSRRLLE